MKITSKIRMKKEVINAIIFLRENNHTIPDEILDLMKKASLKELEKMWDIDTMKKAGGVLYESHNYRLYSKR